MKARQLIFRLGVVLGMIFFGILHHQTTILPTYMPEVVTIGPVRSLSAEPRQKRREDIIQSDVTERHELKEVTSPLQIKNDLSKHNNNNAKAKQAINKEGTNKIDGTVHMNKQYAEKTGTHEQQIQRQAAINAKISSFHSLKDIKGMSSCLFIMDDTIRLIEWLAYHYTVLPLHYLIVGIDPHSKHPERIIKVLDRWRSHMNITIWDNPQTYLDHVPKDKAWKRKYWLSPGVRNPFHYDKTTFEYKSQEHKRRQNIFTSYCFRQHYLDGRSWVMNLDTDEFLIPNYFGNNEDSNSSSFIVHYKTTEESLSRDRQHASDTREHLPDLSKRVTVSEILHQTDLDRCLKIPALNFTAQRGEQAYTGGKDQTGKLLTLSHTKTGPKEGRTTKALLDLSRAHLSWLTWQKTVNVHNPNKRMCGWNGIIGTGTDYISSLFRYHHYVAGSLESYLERAQDYRRRQSGMELMEHYSSRNFDPVPEENTDIFPWLDWFLDIVGEEVAKELLFEPLEQAYALMQRLLQEELAPK